MAPAAMGLDRLHAHAWRDGWAARAKVGQAACAKLVVLYGGSEISFEISLSIITASTYGSPPPANVQAFEFSCWCSHRFK